MTLSISTTNSVKPMAISSITSPPLPNSSLVSPPMYHHRHSSSPHRQSFHPCTAPSPPDSPTYRNSSSYHQQQDYSHQHRHSLPFYNSSYYSTSNISDKTYHRGNSSDDFHERIPSVSSLQAPPLSLQERRQRNKAASAKYRAKKNQQHGEMRSHILSLTKENDLLQRQLDHVRGENNRLKATCDRLRGKILAEKMLKKLLNGREEGEEEDDDMDDEEDMELAEDYLIHGDNHDIQYRKEHHAAMLKKLDEDIEFDDEEDEEYENDSNAYPV